MCWIAFRIEDTVCKKAETDIEVYKLVVTAGKDSCISAVEGYKYDTKVQPSVDFVFGGAAKNSITVGYHSYINIKYKKDELWDTIPLLCAGQVVYPLKDQLDGYYVAKFIIPKGSKYYRNAFDEVVSNRIKYTGQYFELRNCR